MLISSSGEQTAALVIYPTTLIATKHIKETVVVQLSVTVG